MHELGIVFEILRVVGEVAEREGVEKVDAIVLEVGEVGSVVPEFLQECFPAAAERDPRFEKTELRIEVIPGVAKCAACGTAYGIVKNNGYCPACGNFEKELVSGREFNIKEILAE